MSDFQCARRAASVPKNSVLVYLLPYVQYTILNDTKMEITLE